ncbi:hypothetical protein B0H17DRAFT_961649 [Mycena rosella]|uniref:Uncharacterized protein n=1 Tax=Mycena rosella TaxID=1033263 RepID=A0AAD7FRM4_MYCRO|nr:hypothetical protein B0H17DRAFT_961649 [Mycena rosella]
MKLRGVIYGGQGHFTSRIIDRAGNMWFHDGISTGRQCMSEGVLILTSDLMSLQSCGQKNAVAVVYTQ